MTLRQAAADLPCGGGKAVLGVETVPTGDERRALLLRYADLVASLGGTYVTAADMNTREADMDVIGERCPYVLGRSRAAGGAGDPGADTAAGVFHGVRASARHAFGTDELEGRTVLVQGVGSVGSRLAELLAEANATLLLADVDPERAKSAAERLSATAIDADQVIGAECDI